MQMNMGPVEEVKNMKIVCIGDSITHGYKIRTSQIWTSLIQKINEVQVLNKGIIGDSTTNMVTRFHEDVIENNPSHVIIMGGINDLISGVPTDVICENVFALVLQAYVNNIIPIIGVQFLTEPLTAAEYWPDVDDFIKLNKKLSDLRRLLLELSKTYRIKIIDFYTEMKKHIKAGNKLNIYIDGLHLNVLGNEIIASVVNTYLNKTYSKVKAVRFPQLNLIRITSV